MKVEKGLVTLTELISMTTEGTFNNGGNLRLNSGRNNPSADGDSGKKIVTKSEVITPYFVNLNLLSKYALNQLPPYEDIRPGGDCTECYSFDVTITQEDINASFDKKVYVYYYGCGVSTGDILNYLTFSNPGTFKNYFCSQNCAYLPPLIYIKNSNGTLSNVSFGSSLNTIFSNCFNQDIECSNTIEYQFQITSGGLFNIDTKFDIGQTYGNVPVTISYNSNLNTSNSIFIGNYDEKIGEIFTYGIGEMYVEETIGFFSSGNKTTLDVVVETENTIGPFLPYTLTVKVGCPDTLDCGTNLTQKTYLTGTQIQVSNTGYIKYDTNTSTVYRYVSTLGMYRIDDCYIYESLSEGTPYADTAAFTVLLSGYTCDASTDDCSVIKFVSNTDTETTIGWVDCSGGWRIRTLVPNETFEICGIKNSGYGTGVSVSNGSACSTTPQPSNIFFNDITQQYYLPGWFADVANNNNICGGSPISYYYVPNSADLFGPPKYVFQDANGTPFNKNYFVRSLFGFANGYEYNKITGEVGLGFYTCLPSLPFPNT
jgi:hypothetical protein